MDANANGIVTKDEFINYLRSRPQWQHVMYTGLKQSMGVSKYLSNEGKSGEEGEEPSQKASPQTSRAMGIKRIISVYKDMDQNKNGVVTWDEFIDFFRRTGLLLTYSTTDNPRDRMAATLAKEYQRRQAVGNWQKGGAALGVGQKAGWGVLVEELGCKFLIDQKEQQVNTQWAAEKLKAMQDQHAHGRDAFSMVTESVDALKAAARLRVGRSVKRHIDIQDLTPKAKPLVEMYTKSKADVPNPLPVTPTTPRTLKPQTPKQRSSVNQENWVNKDLSSITQKLESEPESVNQENAVEKNESKYLSAKAPHVETSSNAIHLPALIQQPSESFAKSPMRRRKSRSPRKDCQTPSRRRVNGRDACSFGASPIKCGQTPRLLA